MEIKSKRVLYLAVVDVQGDNHQEIAEELLTLDPAAQAR
jgi:hypothetical protein